VGLIRLFPQCLEIVIKLPLPSTQPMPPRSLGAPDPSQICSPPSPPSNSLTDSVVRAMQALYRFICDVQLWLRTFASTARSLWLPGFIEELDLRHYTQLQSLRERMRFISNWSRSGGSGGSSKKESVTKEDMDGEDG
jgi:hypothetical protein